MSAVQLSDAIRSRQVSCAEVMSAYLGRIGRYNPVYNAVVSMADEDILMAEARNADEELAKGQYRGWMHGMPMAIKDLADAEGLQACYGSKIFEGHVADADSLHKVITMFTAPRKMPMTHSWLPEEAVGVPPRPWLPIWSPSRTEAT